MKFRSAENRGSLMLLALMFMVVMAVFVSAFLYTVRVSNKVSASQENNIKAFYLAEAGLNKAIWYLHEDGAWWTTPYPAPAGSGVNDPKTEAFGGGSYTMWVEHLPDGTILIIATGTYRDLTRNVRVVLSSQCS